MSIFGSREEDPLLQDDPLAPSSEDESAPEDEPPAGDDPAPASAEDAEEAPTEEPPDESEGHFALDGEGTTRTLVRSVGEAEHGNLTVLNAAFDQGWRVDCVVYQEESDDLLFQLRREESGSDQNGVIV
jgi:hypothetical protein